jgi:membrane associated rhomboid family serine protease
MEEEAGLREPSPIFVNIFIALNACVFFLWYYLPEPFMSDNFAVSWNALMQGRWWVLLTSVFSHNYLIHILINMFVLRNFGAVIEEALGHRRFFFFYLIAGVVSSLTHAVVSAWVVGEPEMGAVGASGAIAGLVLLFSLFFPREKLYLFAFIPMPAIVGALAFIGLDVWGLVAQSGGGGLPIGHGAHLGGAFSGIVYYLMLRRARLKRR